MKRSLTAVVLAAMLLAGMTARTTAIPQTLVGTASASECSWERQAKRVVKRVKRHGKVRSIVHKRFRWVCVPASAAPIAPAPALAPAAPPQTEPEPEANRVSARASEFYFTLSRPKVKAGEVTVELNNQGEDGHNLNLQREGDSGEPLEIPEAASGQRATAEFDLPAGKYKLWCSLPEHEEKGMYTSLTVE